MSIFKRNSNEKAYVDGKKHFIDVIKNSGPGNLLIWRQPEEDFNTNSTLIVMPGEEAIFINGGIVQQVFENGTHQLSTGNYPFISRFRNTLSGGISVFNSVVYFVRKSDSEEIKWGTETPIQVRDKIWNVRTDVRARGSYKVRIMNPALFLEKLIGNNVSFQTQTDLNKYFYTEFQGKIKSAISKGINSLETELIGLDSYLDELSENIKPVINEALSMYGLQCVSFAISGLDVDKTKYDSIDESQINVISRTRGFQGDKAGLDILGKNWAAVQEVEIKKAVANNPGAGGVAAVGAGIGMGMSAMTSFNSMSVQTNNTDDDPVEQLTKLKKLLDAGLIEQSEYDMKKAEILSKI